MTSRAFFLGVGILFCSIKANAETVSFRVETGFDVCTSSEEYELCSPQNEQSQDVTLEIRETSGSSIPSVRWDTRVVRHEDVRARFFLHVFKMPEGDYLLTVNILAYHKREMQRIRHTVRTKSPAHLNRVMFAGTEILDDNEKITPRFEIGPAL